jgi:hypothetical protein
MPINDTTELILKHVGAAMAAAAATPVPLVDIAAVAVIQVALVRRLARRYGVEYDAVRGRAAVLRAGRVRPLPRRRRFESTPSAHDLHRTEDPSAVGPPIACRMRWIGSNKLVTRGTGAKAAGITTPAASASISYKTPGTPTSTPRTTASATGTMTETTAGVKAATMDMGTEKGTRTRTLK